MGAMITTLGTPRAHIKARFSVSCRSNSSFIFAIARTAAYVLATALLQLVDVYLQLLETNGNCPIAKVEDLRPQRSIERPVSQGSR